MSQPRRPALRYHGGKWTIAPWIISQFPEHRIYVEPYGGGGSVLLRKHRSYAEVYNDLDGEIVNVFRCIRDRGKELKEKLRLTPFARDEFIGSYEVSDCPLEQARRTIIRSFMGFGSNSVTAGKGKSGFRANANRAGTTPAHDWKNYADVFDLLIDRMRGIVIENREAIKVMSAHDSPETLHYVDPPYVFDTRADARHGYNHEMTDQQHLELGEFLKGLKGMVVLSGYRGSLYDDIYEGWKRLDRSSVTNRIDPSIESLWLSPNINHMRLL